MFRKCNSFTAIFVFLFIVGCSCLIQDSLSLGGYWYLNMGPSKYEAEVITIQLQHSVTTSLNKKNTNVVINMKIHLLHNSIIITNKLLKPSM